MTRRGATSIELIITIALVALVSSYFVPSLRYLMDRRAVDLAAQQVIDAHKEARLYAITSGRTALLLIAADSLVLRSARGGDTLLVWKRPGPRGAGVQVAGNPRLMRFIPYGYTIGGSNTTFTMTRGSASRAVVISRLGRVRTQ